MFRQGESTPRRGTASAVLLAAVALTSVAIVPAWSGDAPATQRRELRYELAYAIPGPGLYTAFGHAVAARRNRLFVGAPSEDGDSYVAAFDLRSGAPLGLHPGDFDSALGFALAASSRAIAVGVPETDEEPGHVLLLDPRMRLRRAIGGPEGLRRFGQALAWVGSRLFVGASLGWPQPGPDEDRVLLRVDPRRDLVVRTITSPRPEVQTWFGFALAPIRGGLAVASPGAGSSGNTAPGRVYLYDRNGDLARTLARPESAEGDHFGWAVAGFKDRLLVGAPSSWLAGGGAAYLYARREGTWVLERTFVSPEGSHSFGGAVALDGTRALIRGDEKAHLFDLASGDLLATLTPPKPSDPEEPPPYPRGAFGQGVAIAGKTLIVTAPRQDENEEGYVFAFVPVD